MKEKYAWRIRNAYEFVVEKRVMEESHDRPHVGRRRVLTQVFGIWLGGYGLDLSNF
jgi:hypothetical protein